jgi:endonuclease G
MLIIASIVFFNTLVNAKECDQIVQKESYISCFDYKTKQPDYVKYELKFEEVNAVNPNGREGMEFHLDPAVDAKYQLKPSDYTNSGFDRGHLYANANADFSQKAQYDSFSMVNITLQYPVINRDVYLSLEKYERGVVFQYKRVISYSGAIDTVDTGTKLNPPEYLYKVIHIPSINLTEVYIIPNVPNPQYPTYKSYKSDLETLEKLSGYTYTFQ